MFVLGACSEGDDGPGGEASDETGGGGNVEDVLGPVEEAQGEPVRVGFVSDGAYQAADQTIEFDVAEATVAFLNERRGGIGGRPVELVTCETQGDPARATDCGNQLVDENVVAVLFGSSAVLEAAWQPLADADVPTVFAFASAPGVLEDPDSSFVFSDPTAGTIDAPIAMALDAGVDKVTVVVIDVPAALDAYGGDTPGTFADAGLELDVVPVPPGTPDMTPQMQEVASDDPGLVMILGNDAFCIGALQGLEAVAFEGPIMAVSQCVTDATREAIPSEQLDGIVTPSPLPVGVDDESTALYRAVAESYGDDIDTSRIAGLGAFTVVAGFDTALDGISGDITTESVVETMRAMPDAELPGGGGLHYRCSGEAVPGNPAICAVGTLMGTLDGDGNPAGYEPTTDAPIEG